MRWWSWAHPRAGGENDERAYDTRVATGSSPRGRGKPAQRVCEGHDIRLIPARAGKTLCGECEKPSSRAHPRAGGENVGQHFKRGFICGSSPRGRGKPAPSRPSRRRPRLIPARAGKTLAPRSSPVQRPAHPRAGGENRVYDMARAVAEGSSPRGRGKLFERETYAPFIRLIPARAGKTWLPRGRGTSGAAHPRAGGENIPWFLDDGDDEGSSPRGRGKHFLTCAFIERIGQILETLELAVSSGSYSLCDVYATDAPQDQARNTGLALPSSRAAS